MMKKLLLLLFVSFPGVVSSKSQLRSRRRLGLNEINILDEDGVEGTVQKATMNDDNEDAILSLGPKDVHDSKGVAVFGTNIGQIDHGDWVMYKDINFGEDKKHQIKAHVESWMGGWIEVRLDDPVKGPLVGKVLVTHTQGDNGATYAATLDKPLTGKQSAVYLVFVKDLPDSEEHLFVLNWVEFSSKPMTTTGNPLPLPNHVRTADPSAHVWPDDPDTIWLYASHDPSNATDYDTMDGYHVFSSQDLKTWTDHGEVLHSRDVSWGQPGWMWAPDACYRNGMYYFYYPHKGIDGDWKIGIATSEVPEGPFTDIGHFMDLRVGGTDPACFTDDDGESYLYYGQRKVGKLAENMIELAEPVQDVKIDYDGVSEGAWMHKRNGIYYYSFTQLYHDESEYSSVYAMGKTPYGPFDKIRPLNEVPAGAQDHHSIVEFKGDWYYFYHKGGPGVYSGARRMVCVDKVEYNEDGTMEPIEMTANGVPILD